MKALTLHPPWSHAIAWLGKDVECRSWMTYYRGPLAIHASAAWSFDGETDPRISRAWVEWARTVPNETGIARALNRHSVWVKRSAVVAVAELVEVHRNRGCCEPWGNQPYTSVTLATKWHWLLRDIRPLARSVRSPGRQGLWNLAPDVQQKVRAALAVSPRAVSYVSWADGQIHRYDVRRPAQP